MTLEVKLIGVKRCLSKAGTSASQVIGCPDSDSDDDDNMVHIEEFVVEWMKAGVFQFTICLFGFEAGVIFFSNHIC